MEVEEEARERHEARESDKGKKVILTNKKQMRH